MIYQRSHDIEVRLETVLRLIRTGKYSTPMIAQEVEVSIPTVSRCVNALRERGHEIRSQRQPNGWRYVLSRKAKAEKPATDRTLTEIIG